MDEEDDSGYEARSSTVTTSNSIHQTDLRQLIYQNNLTNTDRPLHYSNYQSEYASESLILQTISNELRSPNSLNSSNLTSRPQSSAYSTISSCSLNRQFNNQQQLNQDYPQSEEYQPLDQFRTIDNRLLLEQQLNSESTLNMSRRIDSPIDYQSNRRTTRSSSDNYEQDWSETGEQDDDSDYIVDHVLPIHQEIELTTTTTESNRRYNRLLVNDLEQNDNDIEEFNEEQQYLEDEYLENIDDEEEDDISDDQNLNILKKQTKKDDQLVNILNSPLEDHSPFLSSPSLSLPSTSSNSNDRSNNSSPRYLKYLKQQKSKFKLPTDSESSFELPTLKSTPKSPQSSKSSKTSKSSELYKNLDEEHSSSFNKINNIEQNNQQQHKPISEEEFTSRKKNLRERINNTFRILNSINNNCNRINTITSRSQELLNQRRLAELEIDNIVQQSATISDNLNTNNINKNNFINNNNLHQQQPRLERDLKSTIDCENEMNSSRTQEDKKQEVSNIKTSSSVANKIIQLNLDRMDKTQNLIKPAGDILNNNNNLNKLNTTIELSSCSSSNKIYKDSKLIDHQLNNYESNTLKNVKKNSLNDTEWPTPKIKPPIPQDSKIKNNIYSNKSTINTGSSNNLNFKNLSESNDKKYNSDSDNQLSPIKNKNIKSSSIANLATTSEFNNENKNLKLSSISNSDTEQMKRNYNLERNKNLLLKKLSSSKLDLVTSDDHHSNNNFKFSTPKASPRSSRNESSKLFNIKNSKIKNNLKINLSEIKSDLNDLNELLNTPTATSLAQNSQTTTNNKLMSFVMQQKSVNTDIDSRLMDHILAKICAQREKELNEKLSESNKPSTSSTNNNSVNDMKPTTSSSLTNQQQQQNKNQITKLTAMNNEKIVSKYCQTDKIQNQDASVSVKENDFENNNKNSTKNKVKKEKINSEKNKKSESESESDNNNEDSENKHSKDKNDQKICEDCKKKCHSKQLIECKDKELKSQFNRNESLSHCCIKRTQDSYTSSCSSIFHHLPVCINTFNHNTFATSLPNLHHSPINRVEQGTNTEISESELDKQRQEELSNKRDKQTQCTLGLSFEEQQREYFAQQQQKYAKLKSELSKQNQTKESEIDNLNKKTDQKSIESDKLKKEVISKKDEKKEEEKKVEEKEEKIVEKKEEDKKKDEEIEFKEKEAEIKQPKREKKSIKENEKIEDEKYENIKQIQKSDSENDEILSIKSEKDTAPKNNKLLKMKTDSIETSLPEKDESKDLSNSYDKKEDDITLPIITKLPFEHQTSKLERKLIDSTKDKNIKTHSKIIIEFSGRSKREKSAVDSMTKFDKDGRLTKKTLVSNTKEVSVPIDKIPIKITKEYLINKNENEPNTNEEDNNNSTSNNLINYPLSSTPQINQLIDQNTLNFYKTNKNNDDDKLINHQQHQWKEASHSEITNEMYADPLLDENNQAHPTRSITLSTITTFDQTAQGQPQRIDHSNKYQRSFENPSIHEPLIQSNFTMVDEPQLSNQEEDENSNSSDENQIEIENKVNNEEIENGYFIDNNDNRKKQLEQINKQNESDQTQNLNRIQYQRSEPDSSTESRSSESRLSNLTQTNYKPNDQEQTNMHSRSASRVSFNLPYNYRDSVDENSQLDQQNNKYPAHSIESNLDQINNFNDENRHDERQIITNLDDHHQRAGLLETDLNEQLFYEDSSQKDNIQNDKKDEDFQQNIKPRPRTSKKSSSSKSKSSKDKKTKSSKRKSTEQISDQSSSYSTMTNSHPQSISKLNDSGFLSPEIYHSSPYELAYNQVNDKKQQLKSDKKKSNDKLERKSKHKNLLKQHNDLQFTEHSSNTEIITRLTKTSYPSNYTKEDLAKLTNDSQKKIEKSLKNLKRNKMVLDQILNSPDFKPSSSGTTTKKSSSHKEKKKRSNCKISSQITMDLPIYKEERLERLEKTKSVSCPLKSIPLDKEKDCDLDRKSIVSQHSYSQQSGEFNTMTKFQRYKPLSKSVSKKNKSTNHLNTNQPDETNWEYTMSCNCLNGSKANVLTNVKHRRMLYFPLQQYETSL